MITALMLGALALTLALTLAGMGFSHLTISNRLSNISQARTLAEAVVSKGIERLVSTEGKAFGPDSSLHDLSVSFAGAPGGTGTLTFDQADAASRGLPCCTNNLKGDTSKEGFSGRLVPPHSVHFVGIGTHNGVTRMIESIVNFPSYQFALSSKGPISSEGNLIVAGADDPEDLLPSVEDALARGDLLPGHVASNSSDNGALTLKEGATKRIKVTGDARAAGTIETHTNIPDGKIIDGDERPNAGTVDLPSIDIGDFDPTKLGEPQGLPDPSKWDEPVSLDGLVRHNGDVVLNGKLNLPSNSRGSILWVNGDLTLNQGLQGVGAIFATGNVIIRNAGQSNLNSDNVCAIVAGKKLTVEGEGANGAFFQGVVASGDDMTFSGVTVAGAAVVGVSKLNGTDLSTSNPQLTLADANVINTPTTVDFDFQFEVGMGGGAGGGSAEGWGTPNVPPSMSVDSHRRPNFEVSQLYDPASDDFVPGPGGWAQFDGFTPYTYDEATHTHSGSPNGFRVRDPGAPDGWRFLNRAELEAQMYTIGTNYGPITNGQTGSARRDYANWNDYFADPASRYHSMADLIDGWVDSNVNGPKGVREGLAKLNQWYDDHTSQSQQSGHFSLDPNRFVQWDSRTKIALWREL